jgi:hypothetical protein
MNLLIRHLCMCDVLQADQEDTPESTYQATFDTSPQGDWTTVRLPWHNFVPVKRAQSDPKGAPLDPSQISKLGLVLSRWALLSYHARTWLTYHLTVVSYRPVSYVTPTGLLLTRHRSASWAWC